MSLENTHFGFHTIDSILKQDGCRKKIFFIGIGGVSMSSLAHLAKRLGYEVSGYDRSESRRTKALEADGITVFYEEDGSHVEGCAAVVYTVAISAENKEYVRAKALDIPLISRADFLGYAMCAYRYRIGISGTHGKSTTTGLLSGIFMCAGTDPTVFSGAEIHDIGAEYRIGAKNIFIYEACEYMDSFLDFCPTTAIVLNIEKDHLDYFSSLEQIEDSFGRFMDKTTESNPAGGCVVINADDPSSMRASAKYQGKLVTFGIDSPDADYRAEEINYIDGKACFDILYKGEYLCGIRLNIPGTHCVYDALAAAAAAHVNGISPLHIAKGLAEYGGIERRMEYRGKTAKGADVYDDYAHHPTEIKTTVSAVAAMAHKKLWCIFQPHTFTRTAELFDEFSGAFTGADHVICAEIYAARETENPTGVSAEKLAATIPGAVCPGDFDAICAYVSERAEAGDIILVMGAGDITAVSHMLVSGK